ncbi:MAG: response regulator transcription factor [Bacteroidales bacterium]|nr:response regulator transcription factor [Bacteroidales bacterium]
MSEKRIIIADDHAVVRTGLQLILDETPDLCIADEARNGDELLVKLENEFFDLIILDLYMPGRDSLDVLKEIKQRWPSVPVIIFTMNPDDIYAIRMIRNGASAFINKETQPPQIIDIIRTVLSGRKYLSHRQSEMLTEMFSEPLQRLSPIHEQLTDREFQIFVLLTSGLKKNEISNRLSISKNTLNNHKTNILKK